jgi:LAO/AO transport system kinase
LLLKLQEPVMSCKVLKGIMEMADTIVINKADGDNIQQNSLNQSSTERCIYFQQKIRLDSYNCNLQCNYTRRNSRSLGNHHNLSNSRKAMIILMKTLEQNEYWMLEAINEQLKGGFL